MLLKTALATVLCALLPTPSYAFFDEIVIGLTSVTNNLIHSSESVTNNTVNVASTTMISLSGNPGKMADRIGLMADRIGYMADRIVTTEGLMAGLGHSLIDSNQQSNRAQQYATFQPLYEQGGSPTPTARSGSNPYLALSMPVAYTPNYAPARENYSASQMIFGVPGASYNATQPFAAKNVYEQAAPVTAAQNYCGYSYGVAKRC